MRFFTGLHQPSDAQHFDAAFVSVNRLRTRKGPFSVGDWIMDSGAFTEVTTHGGYRHTVAEYASEIRRWSANGRLLAAVAQDWMCEPFVVAKTGLSVERHQQLTVERYDALLAEDTAGVYILPVLQGYAPEDYTRHLVMYGDRLAHGAWVGVGSVCKRNGKPQDVAAVLLAIKRARPDLRLHGFGLKTTALADPLVRSLLHTADSMAWSFHARINGRNGNDWREAKRWTAAIDSRPVQHVLDLLRAGCAALLLAAGPALADGCLPGNGPGSCRDKPKPPAVVVPAPAPAPQPVMPAAPYRPGDNPHARAMAEAWMRQQMQQPPYEARRKVEAQCIARGEKCRQVPEPGSFLLTLVAIAVLIAVRRWMR